MFVDLAHAYESMLRAMFRQFKRNYLNPLSFYQNFLQDFILANQGNEVRHERVNNHVYSSFSRRIVHVESKNIYSIKTNNDNNDDKFFKSNECSEEPFE